MVIGVGDLTLSVMTREPVTVTSLSSSSSAGPPLRPTPAENVAVPMSAAIEARKKRCEDIPSPSN